MLGVQTRTSEPGWIDQVALFSIAEEERAVGVPDVVSTLPAPLSREDPIFGDLVSEQELAKLIFAEKTPADAMEALRGLRRENRALGISHRQDALYRLISADRSVVDGVCADCAKDLLGKVDYSLHCCCARYCCAVM